MDSCEHIDLGNENHAAPEDEQNQSLQGEDQGLPFDLNNL
jgi:hypothetical protein